MKHVTSAADLYTSASSLTSRPRAFVADLDVPDLDLGDAADHVADFASDVAGRAGDVAAVAADRAGDVAALAAVEGARGLRALTDVIRRNPIESMAVVALVAALVAYTLGRKRATDDVPRV